MIVDLFAGPGGWSTGLNLIGRAETVGIEWDKAACDTARAAGHERLQADIAELDPHTIGGDHVEGLIASPPCQGFSMAGKGKGREDSALIIAAAGDMASGVDPRDTLRAKVKDKRSVLALEPLRWALELEPEWTAWEQVPAVLPLWEACAEVLRADGYSVWTGLVQAEQYGVPQTRKRAILTATRNGVADRPVPTHSKYYARSKDKLDPGTLKWVSMAEALGRSGNVIYRSTTMANSARRPLDCPAPTIAFGHDSGSAVWMPIAANEGTTADDMAWVHNRPSPTIIGSFAPDVVAAPGYRGPGDGPRQKAKGSVRVTVQEAGILQSFPASGYYRLEISDMTRDEFCAAILAAGWLTVDTDQGKVYRHRGPGGMTLATPAEVVGSNCNGYLVGSFKVGDERKQVRLHRLVWTAANGAIPDGMTVDHINGDKTDNRIANLRLLTAADNSRAAHEMGLCDYERKIPLDHYESIAYCAIVERVTQQKLADVYGVTRGRIGQIVREQGYPWQGSKTAQYRQCGDAVPPVMAAHILASLGVGQLAVEAAA